jgi:RimJ/RimL family protein N-acetyltransferase
MSDRAEPSLAVGDLAGRHVRLERLRIDHVDAIAAAGAGDRSSYGWTGVPDGIAESRIYVTGLVTDAAHARCAPFAQRRLVDDVIVGCTRFMSPAWPLGRSDPDEIEIGGTWLSADAQRSPINTEAKLLLLTHAFETWTVRRVAICTDARNERSRAAIERLGATFEGVLRQHRASTAAGEAGTLRDTATYSITAAEWPDIQRTLVAKLTG